MGCNIIKEKKFVLEFFGKFNGSMVRTSDKHDASRFKSKHHAINK
jgi:hypothetical protein